MRRYVQTDHHPYCGDPDRPVPEDGLLRAISGGEAGICRIEEADRLSGMGHFVPDRLWDPVFDNQSDPSDLEVMSKASAGQQCYSEADAKHAPGDKFCKGAASQPAGTGQLTH